ncbi:MAG: tetratricopeptide repeat protein [Betaproteobacteria bacterium]|nr:tetratricopeptide repeat protein [Betaproteobacteria bacterium]
MNPPKSRNDPCPCGSGKRYKHCHGADNPPATTPAPMAADAADPLAMARAALRAGRHADAARIVVAHHGEAPLDFAALKVLAEALRPTDDARSRECWERALRAAPDDPEALFFVGDFCREAGEHARAIELFERALVHAPDHPALLNNLGLAREKVQVGSAGEPMFRRALEGRARLTLNAMANLAQNLYQQRRHKEAIPEFERLVKRMPAAPAEIWANYGVSMRASGISWWGPLGGLHGARARARPGRDLVQPGLARAPGIGPGRRSRTPSAIALDPDDHTSESMLLHACGQECVWDRFDERRAASSTPRCTPKRAGAHRHALSRSGDHGRPRPRAGGRAALDRARSPAGEAHGVRRVETPGPARPGLPVLGLSRAIRWAASSSASSSASTGPDSACSPSRRARKEARRSQPQGPQSTDSGCSRRRCAGSRRGDPRRSDRRPDRPDRPHRRDDGRRLSLRPAPVQVNFLGYTGTIGSSAFDWILADRYCIPPEVATAFDERPLYIEPCYLPGRRPRQDRRGADVAPELRAARGRGGLRRADGAVQDPAGAVRRMAGDPAGRSPDRSSGCATMGRRGGTAARHRRGARRRSRRLTFARTEPVPRYLARFRLADLFLDTWPFGSHTTVNDALFAGLPVLAHAGRSFAARACASQVLAAGLDRSSSSTSPRATSHRDRPGRDPARLREWGAAARAARDAALFDLDHYARRSRPRSSAPGPRRRSTVIPPSPSRDPRQGHRSAGGDCSDGRTRRTGARLRTARSLGTSSDSAHATAVLGQTDRDSRRGVLVGGNEVRQRRSGPASRRSAGRA